MHQHRMAAQILHDLLDLQDRFHGDDHRGGLVSGDYDADMVDAGLFDEFIELIRVLGVDQGALGGNHQNYSA